MPMGQGYAKHGMRQNRRYNLPPYYHFSCTCGVSYGRMTEPQGRRKHQEHLAKVDGRRR